MVFDIESAGWDNQSRKERAEVIAEQITQDVHLKNHFRALEFGCGTGLISFNLIDRLKDITCVDISKGMIDTLKSKIQEDKVKNIVAYRYDINEDEFLIPSYDLIYTSMALHHILNVEAVLKKLYSLLKKDAHMCIIELNEDDGSFHRAEKDFNGHNGFSQNGLKEMLAQIGLEEIKSRTFYYGEKMIDEVNVKYSLFIMTGRK